MAIVILRTDGKSVLWKKALLDIDPSLEVFTGDETHPKAEIRMAIVWKHKPASMLKYPGLKAIQSFGAGVDFILEDPGLPPDIPVLRVVDPFLAADMAEYILAMIMARLRLVYEYEADAIHNIWQPRPYGRIASATVGIMGLGTLGREVAGLLCRAGFNVRGWTLRTRPEVDYPVFTGERERKAFLEPVNYLVCLMPLTPKTRGIMNRELFQSLPMGAYIINAARGGLLEDGDLLAAIGDGRLSGACLDVFQTEPLPKGHPFWSHPAIHITPHIASVSDIASVAPQIIANYRALMTGKAPINQVSRERGY